MVPTALLPHLRNAKDLADRHYDAPLDLDALAGAAHVSKYHFARCFARTYGEAPMRYLTRPSDLPNLDTECSPTARRDATISL